MWLKDPTINKTIKVILTIIGFAIFLYFVYRLRDVVFWLAGGAFLALVIDPAVTWVTKKIPGHRRGAGLAIVAIAGFLLLAALFSIFLPPIFKQGSNFVGDIPQIAEGVSANIDNSKDQPYKFLREQGVGEYIQENSDQIKTNFTNFFGKSLSALASIFSGIAAFLTVITMMVYVSIHGPKYVSSLRKLIPKRHRSDSDMLAGKMYNSVTGYILGSLATSVFAGITAGLASAAIGLPYPALMGLIAALTDLIPLIGAQLGGIILGLVGLSVSTRDAVAIVLVITIYQQFENYVLSPKVMSKTVKMTAFAVFVSALCGAVLAGFIGALVAIPVGACIQILFHYSAAKLGIAQD